VSRKLINPDLLARFYRDEIRRIVLEHKGLNPRVVKTRNRLPVYGEIGMVIDAGEGQSVIDLAQMGFALGKLFGFEVTVVTTAQLSEFFHARSYWAAEVTTMLNDSYPL
jgi:hypothetical protein